ncbi:aspartyl-phosphate phosphatase Spo0E family protein [Desulfotruncus alcoholivorax]|uniref:aspartyl-phosphate phosphatase Spo0E family protein n=1 Tax=Desulfotruncus alcoholivorax TaxID=265477 RepID=UPI00042658C3|nr:aspartyl-phosphate phosphatase Spo0E family protein [Desulfotruncus alcoholivorax]
MDLLNWGRLLVNIEVERRKLYEISKNEPNNYDKMLQVSQRLDKLINKYQREVKSGFDVRPLYQTNQY